MAGRQPVDPLLRESTGCRVPEALPGPFHDVGRSGGAVQPDDFFAGRPNARAVFEEVRSILNNLGPVEVRTSKSHVAFRRQRGFAFLWLPGRYLSKPTAEVVLSIALGRHEHSARFKEVAHPGPSQWMHHMEIRDVADIDGEVVGGLREAANRAS